MAKRKQAAAEAAQSTPAEAAAPPAAEAPIRPAGGAPRGKSMPPRDAVDVAEGEPPADAVNPFPHNVKTVIFRDGYAVRLNQVQDTNEMRIQFGSGQRIDKPSDAALDHIRRQLVPEELQTAKERAEGKPVPWFKFRGDPETGEGTWRMWLRNHPHAAREKAAQVFKAVVDIVAEERGPGRPR